MKNKITTKQAIKLRQARAKLSVVIKGMVDELDELTKENKSISTILVEAENLISEVVEEIIKN